MSSGMAAAVGVCPEQGRLWGELGVEREGGSRRKGIHIVMTGSSCCMEEINMTL